MTGGYSEPHTPTEEEMTIFKRFESEVKAQANADETEVVSCATQIVAGCNFKYVIKAGNASFTVIVFRGLKSPDDLSLTSVTAQ